MQVFVMQCESLLNNRHAADMAQVIALQQHVAFARIDAQHDLLHEMKTKKATRS
jgi:hypothetical protein